MSKKTKESKTKTSEYSYLEEAKHNTGLAMQWLITVFPELSEIKRLMDAYDIPPGDIIDYMYHLRVVKTHGYGHVQTKVFEGRITNIEGLLRTLRLKETEIAK
jgi:hypothetical protein